MLSSSSYRHAIIENKPEIKIKNTSETRIHANDIGKYHNAFPDATHPKTPNFRICWERLSLSFPEQNVGRICFWRGLCWRNRISAYWIHNEIYHVNELLQFKKLHELSRTQLTVWILVCRRNNENRTANHDRNRSKSVTVPSLCLFRLSVEIQRPELDSATCRRPALSGLNSDSGSLMRLPAGTKQRRAATHVINVISMPVTGSGLSDMI